MINLIGLYSPAMASGKTTLTESLVDLGWSHIRFAGTLKHMISVLLEDLGHYAPDFVDGHRKEEVLPGLGVTTRYLMQTLGAEWGRNQVCSSLWIDIAKARIERALAEGHRVVVDDVRFDNEFLTIKNLGGAMVRIVRPTAQDRTGHVSEGGLNNYAFDFELRNEHGLTEWKGMAEHFHHVLGSRGKA